MYAARFKTAVLCLLRYVSTYSWKLSDHSMVYNLVFRNQVSVMHKSSSSIRIVPDPIHRILSLKGYLTGPRKATEFGSSTGYSSTAAMRSCASPDWGWHWSSSCYPAWI
jgi:hypothetical protein